MFHVEHPRTPAAAGRDAREKIPQKDNNRTIEAMLAAVVREVAADGAGGEVVKLRLHRCREERAGEVLAEAERTTRAEVAASGAGGGSEVKATPTSRGTSGGGVSRNETNDPRGTTDRTEAASIAATTLQKDNNRTTGARGGASRRGRSTLQKIHYADI